MIVRDDYSYDWSIINKGLLADWGQGQSQADFVDAVVMERGWEFAAEVGVRWFDYVKTETIA